MKLLSLLFLLSVVTFSNCTRSLRSQNTLKANKEITHGLHMDDQEVTNDTAEVRESCVPEVTVVPTNPRAEDLNETQVEIDQLGYDPSQWIEVNGTFFPNTDNCKIIEENGGLRYDSPLFQSGFLQGGEMWVYKMDMHAGQTARSLTSGNGDIDIFYLWDDCPFVSEDQEWVESVAMGFTDSHESKEEDVEFQAPSNGALYIAVRAYDAGKGHDSVSTFTLATMCNGEKQLCRDSWTPVEKSQSTLVVKTDAEKALDESITHGHTQTHMDHHHSHDNETATNETNDTAPVDQCLLPEYQVVGGEYSDGECKHQCDCEGARWCLNNQCQAPQGETANMDIPMLIEQGERHCHTTCTVVFDTESAHCNDDNCEVTMCEEVFSEEVCDENNECIHVCPCQGPDCPVEPVEPEMPAPEPVVNCKVTVYQHGDFGGWAVTFPEGDYDYAAFTGAGAVNDDASAIKVVGQGCVATCYQHGDFGGWAASFPEGDYNFGAFTGMGAVNDDMSALRVSHK